MILINLISPRTLSATPPSFLSLQQVLCKVPQQEKVRALSSLPTEKEGRMSRLEKIAARIEQANDRKLLRLLNRAWWREWFRNRGEL